MGASMDCVVKLPWHKILQLLLVVVLLLQIDEF
jgi:hypothetical protein